MLVKIPMFPKAEDAKPLERCIEHASRKTGVDHYTAVLFMTHFLDQVADEVSKGRTVSIPGFGLFAAVLRKIPLPEGLVSKMLPRFSPSRGFRNQVELTCPMDMTGTKKFYRHRSNQRTIGGSRSLSDRVFTAMENIRESISKQLGHARDDDDAGGS
jgi:hypothetical protein